MGLVGKFLGVLGFAVGISLGLLVGFFLFVYSETKHVKDPVVRPISDMGPNALQEILPEIPLWMKTPDYELVDWLNNFLLDMCPFLDKAICRIIRNTTRPIFAEYIGKKLNFAHEGEGCVESNGSLIGIKVSEINEKELVMKQVIKWASNPDIVLALHVSSFKIIVQLLDLQIFGTPWITLRPLVPTLPCFSNIVVSLMEKLYVDFRMSISSGDIMSILVPILDKSMVAIKKPVGILHVNMVRAHKLLKMDFLGNSDPCSLASQVAPLVAYNYQELGSNPPRNSDILTTSTIHFGSRISVKSSLTSPCLGHEIQLVSNANPPLLVLEISCKLLIQVHVEGSLIMLRGEPYVLHEHYMGTLYHEAERRSGTLATSKILSSQFDPLQQHFPFNFLSNVHTPPNSLVGPMCLLPFTLGHSTDPKEPARAKPPLASRHPATSHQVYPKSSKPMD
ncbi:hypothetical protein VNO77_18750 [Canavalia gladiata]|uniref:SMP-LTD domain-containing protein n=1 Tax=Canavalia gladiata TaxID=3824 RepID=A0AAN9QHY9_CANGL